MNISRASKMMVFGLLISASASAALEVAKVNGKPVTSKDMESALSGLNEGQRKSLLKDPTSKRQLLKNVIDQEILVQEAEKQKLDQDAEYKDALAAFRKQYLSNRLLQKELATKATDAEAKKYYSIHKSEFTTDEVHAQHILVNTEAEAKELLAKAKAAGADFQELAEKNSKDPSAKNNRGDLGFFTRDRMVPEFTTPVFKAAEGEIIGPIHTSFGYHIVKIVERKSGHPLGYDEVELKVKTRLNQSLVEAYVGKLKESAKIQVDDQSLNKI